MRHRTLSILAAPDLHAGEIIDEVEPRHRSRAASRDELEDRILRAIAEINEQPVVFRWKKFDLELALYVNKPISCINFRVREPGE